MALGTWLLRIVSLAIFFIFGLFSFNNADISYPLKFLNIPLYRDIVERIKEKKKIAYVSARLILFCFYLLFMLIFIDGLGIKFLSFHEIYRGLKIFNYKLNAYLVLLFIEGTIIMFLNYDIMICLAEKLKLNWYNKKAKQIEELKPSWKITVSRLAIYILGLILICTSIIIQNRKFYF